MTDIIGFNDQGVHVIYGNGRGNFTIRNGSTLKLANHFRVADGYTTQANQTRFIADINGDGNQI